MLKIQRVYYVIGTGLKRRRATRQPNLQEFNRKDSVTKLKASVSCQFRSGCGLLK